MKMLKAVVVNPLMTIEMKRCQRYIIRIIQSIDESWRFCVGSNGPDCAAR